MKRFLAILICFVMCGFVFASDIFERLDEVANDDPTETFVNEEALVEGVFLEDKDTIIIFYEYKDTWNYVLTMYDEDDDIEGIWTKVDEWAMNQTKEINSKRLEELKTILNKSYKYKTEAHKKICISNYPAF